MQHLIFAVLAVINNAGVLNLTVTKINGVLSNVLIVLKLIVFQ